MSLVWEFEVELSETVRSVSFLRQRDVADLPIPVAIAASFESRAFILFPQFISNYSARLPATLILRNAVTSDQEFIYSIEVSFLRNNLPRRPLQDRVQVIVQGKHEKAPFLLSPPVFQLFPENPCSFTKHNGTSIQRNLVIANKLCQFLGTSLYRGSTVNKLKALVFMLCFYKVHCASSFQLSKEGRISGSNFPLLGWSSVREASKTKDT